jgi:meso-butanediol dehydrogenase/(S,S)-butanediol dehydrogenase/diacetyl reductase
VPPANLPEGVLWVTADVSSKLDVIMLRERALAEHGRIDVLVNNAGLQIEKTLPDTSDDDWDLMMGVNVKGVFLCCREIIPLMRAAGSGVIVNLGSISGFHADSAMAVYNASKAFVHGLTRSIAVDHGSHGIRCNAVCPGWVSTEMADSAFDAAKDPQAARRDALRRHPLGRLGTPDDIASIVVWLASDETSFITGQTYIIDGGLVAASPLQPRLF